MMIKRPRVMKSEFVCVLLVTKENFLMRDDLKLNIKSNIKLNIKLNTQKLLIKYAKVLKINHMKIACGKYFLTHKHARGEGRDSNYIKVCFRGNIKNFLKI